VPKWFYLYLHKDFNFLFTMKNILISGSSGLVGTKIINNFSSDTYNFLKLVSSVPKDKQSYQWHHLKGIENPPDFSKIDGVIHLAGAGVIDKAWTIRRKEEILLSRVNGAKFIREAFEKVGKVPDFFITASGIGYFPVDSEKVFTEEDLPGDSFLSKVCIAWEQEAEAFKALGSKVYVLRFGSVLAKEKGFLPALLKPINLYAGSTIGSGKQYVPWVHIDDIVNIVRQAVENKLSPNIYNTCAPEMKTMGEINKAIANKAKRPLFLPNVPSFLIRLLFGERADLLLTGIKAQPHNLLEAGFKFKYTKLDDALDDLIIK
jgi:uncharacterized protein